MKLDTLEMIARGRAQLADKGVEPPYVINLTQAKFDSLVEEMLYLDTWIGAQFGSSAPRSRQDGTEYLGTILGDVHVYLLTE